MTTAVAPPPSTVDPTTATLPSACPLDCPDSCSLDVRVEDGRVTKLDGSRVNPVTDGYICAKVRRFPQHVYGPERLLTPLRRVGAKGEGRFAPISWDEALGTIAERIARVRATSGGEAILPLSYGGSNGALTQDSTDARFFWRLGASRILHTVCAAPTGAAASGLYGKMPGTAFEDFVEAKMILVWGVNPAASGIHQVPLIKEAQARGARLAVVDPRRTLLAKQADLHLPVRPGTDLPVALSILAWLFREGHADRDFLATHATGVEELERRAAGWSFERAAAVAGVEARAIAQLAEMYQQASPALLRAGWGMERNRNGGSAVAAVLALPAVAGKFGVRGGGYVLSNSGAWKLDARAAAQAEPPSTRAINMNLIGRALAGEVPPAADGRRLPVEVLFVYNCNPLQTLPEQERVRQGLAREDLFTVVYEQVMTDTCAYADVVLPATTFLEHHELRRGYGAYVLQHARPVIPPVGEARPNYAVFADLCRRLDLDRPGDVDDPERLADALLDSTGEGDRLRAELATGTAAPRCGRRPLQFVDSFPQTADRKIHLVPEALDREAPLGLYGYQDDPATGDFPLALVSPASSRMVSSTLGQLLREPAALDLHPDDAAARGIADGTEVRVWNRHGEVRCRVRVTRDVAPAVVSLAKGLWSHHTSNGATANALAPDALTDLGGGACFNDARVQVAPA